MNKLEKIKTLICNHFTDVNAQNVVCLPVFSIMEVTKGHLTPTQSIDARGFSYVAGLAGIGSLYSRGNDLTRRLGTRIGFTSVKSEKIIDSIYGAAFFYMYSLALYTAISKMSIADAQPASISAGIIGMFIGAPIGYYTNLFRDAFNFENKDAKPTFLRGASLKKKIGAVVLSTSVALSLTGGAYILKNHYLPSHQPTVVENIDIRK